MPTDPNRSASPDATPRDAASVTPANPNTDQIRIEVSIAGALDADVEADLFETASTARECDLCQGERWLIETGQGEEGPAPTDADLGTYPCRICNPAGES